MHNHPKISISAINHPRYTYDFTEWEVFRDVYNGGRWFRDRYMKKLSKDEPNDEFKRRKEISPVPAFAKVAINEIRNSIYQRMDDVKRLGGSPAYQKAVKQDINRRGDSMTHFMGHQVLTELLVIGKVGVYVDAPSEVPSTLATEPASPYLYYYRAEDILSWNFEDRENKGQFSSVLLRDTGLAYEHSVNGIHLPTGERTRYRLLYRDEEDRVRVKVYDDKDEVVFLENSEPDGSVILDLEQLPFVLLDINGSLLKDAAYYQIALLNLASSAVNFDLNANIPMLTIQKDLRTHGEHLKRAAGEGSPGNSTEYTGPTKGRYYDLETDRPQYIAPESSSLEWNLNHQEKLEDDIRKMVHLNVQGKSGSRTESGEAKRISSQSLEAGLSAIASELENAEGKIARIWATYQKEEPATVAYPSSYSLRSDEDRYKLAEEKLDMVDRIPSLKAKKQIYREVVELLLGDIVTPETLLDIQMEVQESKVPRADLDFLSQARKEGLVSDKLASVALGFPEGEVEQAREDHLERIKRIAISQSQGAGAEAGLENPEQRGVPDLE